MPEFDHRTVICAARHFIAAHESAVRNEPVDFAGVCEKCEFLSLCKCNWLETAAPLFDAAELHPEVCIGIIGEKQGKENSYGKET